MDAPDHRHHDLGGRPAGVCTRDEHEYETWEKRVDALVVLLNYKCGKLTVDELRRYIEELGPVAYDGLGYYERWMHSLVAGDAAAGPDLRRRARGQDGRDRGARR